MKQIQHYTHYGDNNLTPTMMRKRLLGRGLPTEPASARG
jgi:hypothetical protein